MDLVFIKNQKGQDSLIVGSNRYNLSKVNNYTTLWRCVNRSDCSATLTLDLTKTNILRRKRHSCESDHIRNEVLLIIEKCKRDVCTDFGPILPIYERNFEVLKLKGQRYEYEIPSFCTIKNTLYRERK